jgi:Arc/MetJ-type ribon-helix-helix transcriptional regulator
MEGIKTKVVATRVTEPLARIMEEYLRRDAHVTPADFVRDAIREKLKRDVPDLYKTMYQEATVEEDQP